MIVATAPVVEVLSLIALAIVTAGRLLATAPRPRAAAGLGVLVVAPVALLASVTTGGHSGLPHLSAAFVAAGLAAGAVALAGATAVCLRYPRAVMPVALAALPFRVPLDVGGNSVKLLLPLYLVIAAAVLAECIGAWRGEVAEGRAPRGLGVLFAIFLMLYAVQAGYSPDVSTASQNFAFFYAPFALLFGLASNQRWDAAQLRACAVTVVVLALVLVGLGFVEYARGEYLIRPGGIKPNDFDPYFRVQSLFFDPNIFGRFVALVMLTVATVMVYTRRTRRVVVGAAVLAVLWAGLVLTLSQSSFAALLAGLVALAAMRWNARLVLVATGGLLLAGAIFALAVPSISRIDLSNSRSAETSTSGRLDLVTGGLRLWREKPLIGQGSGGFAAAFVRHSLAKDTSFGSPTTTKSHTAPLTVAAEQGLIGLAVFLAWLYAAFATVLRRVRDDDRPGRVARVAVAAAFTALFVHSLSYAALLEDPLTWALLGCAVSLAAIPRVAPAASGGDQIETKT